MTRERDLLEKVISGDNKGDFFVSYDLYKEIYEFLAQPEEEVRKPIVKDASDWSNTPRNSPCPCNSGKKYKMCHGAAA